MIILAGFLGGGAYGAWLARKRKGNRLDMLQYGAGFGIALGLLGMFATMVLERML